MLRYTRLPVSDYYGRNGYVSRDDLAGLNLTTMPKVLVECGNMHNAADAALLVRPGVQRGIAAALAAAIVRVLTARGLSGPGQLALGTVSVIWPLSHHLDPPAALVVASRQPSWALRRAARMAAAGSPRW
jgi:hypothetical protein